MLSRILRLFPEIRLLEAERDRMRGERDSMMLKVRATSAKMGIFEEEARVSRSERDRLRQEVARCSAACERLEGRLRAALAAGGAVTKERNRLAEELATLVAQQEIEPKNRV
jgi:uncharacterized protein YhaN